MRYTVRKSTINVIGKIWMPANKCAQEIVLSAYDLENIEKPVTRDTVEFWLMLNSGDFQSITDFSASLEIGSETIELPWEHEDSEYTYSDCMWPSEFDETADIA